MAAPLKPWEKIGVNNQITNPTLSNEMSGTMDLPVTSAVGGRPPCCQPNTPPVPSRPNPTSTGLGSTFGTGSYGYGSGMGGYGLGGGMYSPYSGGMYGGGMYGGGMYGGYNRFNQQENYATNSFVQQAEQSSRQAFQSVESVVQAFSSIAMMMDSTFYAVYNSFRAILGVADQFSRVKTHITQIFSALAVIRTLRYLFRKLMVLLRLREKGLPEDVWSAAAESSVKAVLSEQDLKSGGGSSWPIFLFFAIIIGGPWLLWKLLSSVTGGSAAHNWQTGDGEHYVAKADFDFTSQTEEELSFKSGQRITIAPKDKQPRIRGWLLASIDGKSGLIPANYVKILGKRKGRMNVQFKENPTEAAVSQEKKTFSNIPEPLRDSEFNFTSSSTNTPSVNTTSQNGDCCKSKAVSASSGCCKNKQESNDTDFEANFSLADSFGEKQEQS